MYNHLNELQMWWLTTWRRDYNFNMNVTVCCRCLGFLLTLIQIDIKLENQITTLVCTMSPKVLVCFLFALAFVVGISAQVSFRFPTEEEDQFNNRRQFSTFSNRPIQPSSSGLGTRTLSRPSQQVFGKQVTPIRPPVSSLGVHANSRRSKQPNGFQSQSLPYQEYSIKFYAPDWLYHFRV